MAGRLSALSSRTDARPDDPLTGAELGTDADPDTGFAEPAGSGAHRAPAAGGGGSSYP